jgi:hypothetical protein
MSFLFSWILHEVTNIKFTQDSNCVLLVTGSALHEDSGLILVTDVQRLRVMCCHKYNYAYMLGGTEENNKGKTNYTWCRLQWLRGLRLGTASAHLVGFRVRIPPGTWMSVSCECIMLSDRTLCVFGLITCPKESYLVRCVWVWSRRLDKEEAVVTRSCCAVELHCDTQSEQRDYSVTYMDTFIFFLQKFSFLNSVGFK